MMVLISAGDLIMLYLGLELMSLHSTSSPPATATCQIHRGRPQVFCVGALSSGMLLYGASLIYGFTGTVSFAGYRRRRKPPQRRIVFGLVFLLAGLCFKVSAVPFHMWTPTSTRARRRR